MAVPVQRTWVTGEVVTAAEMNSNIRDAVNFMLQTPRCIIVNSTNTVIPDSTTPSKFFFDTELVDTDSMHAPSASSQMKANTAGRYEFELYLHYQSYTGGIGVCHAGIQLNNGTSWGGGTKLDEDVRQMMGPNNGGIFGTSTSVRADQFMNANDYVTFWTAQTGNGNPLTVPGGTPFNLQASGRWIASS